VSEVLPGAIAAVAGVEFNTKGKLGTVPITGVVGNYSAPADAKTIAD
jgi:hypothetical protein